MVLLSLAIVVSYLNRVNQYWISWLRRVTLMLTRFTFNEEREHSEVCNEAASSGRFCVGFGIGNVGLFVGWFFFC